MAVSLFRPAFDDLGAALRDLMPLLAAIQAGAGDLPLIQVREVQTLLLRAKAAAARASAEAQGAPVVAEAYMADMGGPATLAAFQAGMTATENAAAIWNAALAAILDALPGMLRLVTVARDGVTAKALEYASSIPAAQADPLRQGPELAGLIAALETAGA